MSTFAAAHRGRPKHHEASTAPDNVGGGSKFFCAGPPADTRTYFHNIYLEGRLEGDALPLYPAPHVQNDVLHVLGLLSRQPETMRIGSTQRTW